MVVKLMLEGKVYPPFRIQILPPQKGDASLAESLTKLSRLKYGRSREVVEMEIADRSRLGA